MKVSALGSYPRIGEGVEKQRLRRAIQQNQAGKISDDELKQIQNSVTKEVLSEQESAGVDWVTDGLIRWEDGQTYFTDQMEGIHRGGLLRYFDTNTYYRQPVVNGPVSYNGPVTVNDFTFAKENTSKPVRPVVTGPFTLARLSLNEHYKSEDELVDVMTSAMNQELQALDAAGATMLQVDEPVLTHDTPDDKRIQEVLRNLTQGVTAPVWIALYMGSTTSLLDRVESWPVAGVWLDCVTDPTVLDKLGEKSFGNGKSLGLGIMDARNTKLETVDQIRAMLDKVAGRTPVERIAVTTSAGLEFLPRSRAQEKLARLSESVQAFLNQG